MKTLQRILEILMCCAIGAAIIPCALVIRDIMHGLYEILGGVQP